ncbi:glycosyltransferase [Sulfuricella sp. T08]|uniref:glycosyltransferase family 4 protein n=1 Tax=Sulfuricella sp. T08 TaxID=1632857 RepID=UPI0006179A03|nr:glycosyltransferase family 4 protein [Sulfuricella sp. T08]GAO34674.1 glycosyltransferase [Sulfuricella sp. T08]
MNILIPVLSLAPAGGSRVLSNLATEWVKLGHRVIFLSHAGGGAPYFPTDAEVIWVNSKAEIVDEPEPSNRSLGFIELFLVMRKAILTIEKGYDVVLLNHSLTVWPSIAAGVRKKCFYYIQLYESEVFFAIPSMRMKILSVFLWATYYVIPKQKCFVNSPIYVGYKNIRTAAPVVPPGIDLDLYWKKPFEGFPATLTIGIIGRKDIWKGTAQAVDSVKELISRGYDVRLKVAYGHHLPESELKGLEGRIEVVVPRNDKELADFYRSVDIMFALATIQLGAPHYPVLESMACGTPVVTTGYFPGDDTTTFLVPINDPKSVAVCVEKMVGEDVSVISQKIDLAREKVLDLSWENVSSVMIKHIMKPLLN